MRRIALLSVLALTLMMYGVDRHRHRLVLGPSASTHRETWTSENYLMYPHVLPRDFVAASVPLSGSRSLRAGSLENVIIEITVNPGGNDEVKSRTISTGLFIYIEDADSLELPREIQTGNIYLIREDVSGPPIPMIENHMVLINHSKQWPNGSRPEEARSERAISLNRQEPTKTGVYKLSFEIPDLKGEYRLVIEDVNFGRLGVLSGETRLKMKTTTLPGVTRYACG